MSRDPVDSPATEELTARRRGGRRLRLVVASGPDRGQAIELRVGRYRVGKDPDNELVIADAAVSRHHLSFEVTPSGILVSDLGSTNGSFYRGARFETIEVDHGAAITIGKTDLQVEAVGSALHLPESARDSFGELLGRSEAMRRVYALLERVSPSDAVVLIAGETGTGKELAARAIHDSSPRRGRPFVVCDLAGMSGSVIESELFGHVRGAFTGAERDRRGAFESADGGTIFLDEVGELSLDLQPRLLRVLESGQIKPVGGDGYQRVDVRVLAATNRDLAAEVAAGGFREDLYHRLAVVMVELPPLRQRGGDLELLVEHFLDLAAAADGRVPPQLAPELWAALRHYHWPGNVRELRNLLERAIALSGGAELLDGRFLGLGVAPAGSSSAPATIDTNVPFHEAKEELVGAWERDYVSALLSRAGGNVSLAARRGGLNRAYLHRLLRKHGLTS